MRLSRAAVVGAAVVVVAGGGYTAYAESGNPAASYRTALAATGDVSQTLALSGTLAPAGLGDLAFTTSGTVSSVRVAVGQHVRAGEVLARLDRVALAAAVSRAQAQMDAAKARLASDEDAQASAVSSSTSSPTRTPSVPPTAHPSASEKPSSSPSSGTDSALLSQIRDQQSAVTTSQTAASGALSDAEAALAAEQQACATSPSPSPTASASPGADQSVLVGQGSTSDGGSSPDWSACDDAIDAVQAAQAKVDHAQTQLQQALDSLATTLSTAAGQTGQTGDAAPQGKPSQQATPSSASTSPVSKASSSAPSASTAPNTGGSGGSGDSGRTVTAATLASDQAQIDSAAAGLVTAQQSLGGATLRASHAGTVGEVDVAKGDSASAGTTAVVVLAPGATDVDLAVTSTQVAKLKVGQVADVTPAGASKPLSGKVTRITPVPDSDGNYPVTITLDQDGLDLPAGGTAAVDVVVGRATDVVTVPTSAVSNGSVEVLDGTTVTRTRVTVGVVGTTRTQVTSGLEPGQRVVLADIDAAVPSSNEQNGFGRLGGGGSFTGFGGGGATFQAPAGGIVVPKG